MVQANAAWSKTKQSTSGITARVIATERLSPSRMQRSNRHAPKMGKDRAPVPDEPRPTSPECDSACLEYCTHADQLSCSAQLHSTNG